MDWSTTTAGADGIMGTADDVVTHVINLDPLLNSLTANIGVILPVAITAMAILAGVSLVPKIFYRFF